MKYLNLSILLLVVVLGFEYFMRDLGVLGVSNEILNVVDSSLLVAAGVFMMAFITSLEKMKSEQKYILYLVVLAVVALKALAFMRFSNG